ncbi:hypothetical protein F4677DRAFT_249038 [Hypoxylon crocopeplum]|nr:hypothetical protein F4677DRAFT_249038 [Hypoxylon crocopeplum]
MDSDLTIRWCNRKPLLALLALLVLLRSTQCAARSIVRREIIPGDRQARTATTYTPSHTFQDLRKGLEVRLDKIALHSHRLMIGVPVESNLSKQTDD